MKGININEAYITMTDKVHKHHREPIILHENWQWYMGEFKTEEQLKRFAERLGFTYEFVGEEYSDFTQSTTRYFKLNRVFRKGKCHKYENSMTEFFWHYEELPSDAKPIIGLSNGCLVTCFFTNDGETISVYRPNPNAKDVYIPMTTEEHIAYIQRNGLF